MSAAPAPAAAPRVVLVGELNPYGARDERFVGEKYDLFPYPAHSAGGRLRRILGLSRRDYLALDRRNLCRGKWSMREARVRAVDVAREHAGGVVVMCGRKVADAFDYRCPLFSIGQVNILGWGGRDVAVSIPHPSGRCREWNDPGAVERVRELLRRAAPDVPWGQGCARSDPCLLPLCGFCGGPT